MTTRRILLVEDNPDDAELTITALRGSGVANEIIVATDGVEALEYLFGQDDAPDPEPPVIVLLDLNLPKISGLEVLRRMRETPTTRMLPVVVLTTSQQDEDVITSYGLGANAYVRKPVDFDAFTEAVHALSVFWLVHNQPPPGVTYLRSAMTRRLL